MIDSCTRVREIQDPEAVLAAEREMAAWIAAHNGAPGVEVHADSDVTWIVQSGVAWANCVVNVRFDERTAGAHLDRILRRYRATKRGVGFWISPFATPAELTQHLGARGLRCRKHFPAMFCDLNALPRTVNPPESTEARPQCCSRPVRATRCISGPGFVMPAQSATGIGHSAIRSINKE